MAPFKKTLICLSLITVSLTACSNFLATSTPSIPTTTSMPIPIPTAMLADTATPMPTATPDIWEIQTCRKAPSIIPNGQYSWMQEYIGDIEGRGEMDMLLNFTKSKEILGFAFDFEQVREYQIYGCSDGRAFTMWLQQEDTVEAVIRGEFPETDPRGHFSASDVLKYEVITGSLVEKNNPESFPIYLRLTSATYGTMEHRFQLAGVEDDAIILSASEQFLAAIAQDERDKVVEMIRFPVEVGKDAEIKEIETSESFLAQYDVIFDEDFRERLAITFPNYLIANAGNFVGTISQLIYDGGGIVFDERGKVIGIYNWKKSDLPPTPSDSDTPVPTPTLSADCGAAKLGKPGTQQLKDSNTPSILVQGTVLLCTNYSVPALTTMFDLDTGKVDIEHADIEYEGPDTIFTYILSSINGASSQYWSFYIKGQQVIEPPQPTYYQCKQQYVDPKSMETEPVYLCVITNEGHVSRVKVEKYSPILAVSWVEISFVTWDEVVVRP